MRNLAKGFLIVPGVVLGLAALGMLGINLYVQSAGTQARIERELSATFGAPVHMTRTTITPWSGLTISGITIPQADGSGNFLEAENFAAYFHFLPLFHHELIFDRVTMKEPKVAWMQSSVGKWRLPAEETASAVPAKSPEPEKPAAKPVEKKEKAAPYAVTVKHFQIARGSFDFFDPKRNRVVSFTDVQVEGSAALPGARGDATSGKVSVRDLVFLQNLRAPFAFTGNELALRGVSAEVAGGALDGNFVLQTEEKHSPFTLDVKFDRVDLDRLLAEAGATMAQTTGSIAGWLDLYGHAGNPDSIAGSGHAALTNGQMKYPFFDFIGQALQIQELSRLDLRQAQVDFRVGDGKVSVDELLLQSPNLKLTARGDVLFNGGLQIEARLTINQRISRQLPAFIEKNFQPGEEPETRSIDFPITGKLSDPRTDLLERMLGQKIQKEVGSLFQSIFGGKRKPPEKKKEKKPKVSSKASPEPGGSASPAMGASPAPSAAASPAASTVE